MDVISVDKNVLNKRNRTILWCRFCLEKINLILCGYKNKMCNLFLTVL